MTYEVLMHLWELVPPDMGVLIGEQVVESFEECLELIKAANSKTGTGYFATCTVIPELQS